jgi:hypothetical protein
VSTKFLPDLLRACDALVTEIDEDDGHVTVHVGPTNLRVRTFDTASEAHELANEIRRCARIQTRRAFEAGERAGIVKADEIAEARRKATESRRTAPLQLSVPARQIGDGR